MIGIPYREAVGALLYAAITFRPDIAYALNQTASFVENLGPAHWSAVKQIVAYLKDTINFGIVFTGSVEKTLSAMQTLAGVSTTEKASQAICYD